MSERLIDIRTELAASPRTRVEIGKDGVLHVLAGPVTLHMDRAICEELTTTLARALVVLARNERQPRRAPSLRLLRDAPREPGEDDGFDTRPEGPTTMPG
jgi:hypothetical protein